jgi:hypothetical protein
VIQHDASGALLWLVGTAMVGLLLLALMLMWWGR